MTPVVESVLFLSSLGGDPESITLCGGGDGCTGFVLGTVGNCEFPGLALIVHPGQVEVELVSTRTVVDDPGLTLLVEGDARFPISSLLGSHGNFL